MNLDIWIQNDLNPFIIFSEKGKIKYLNNEAEYLVSFVDEKKIFEFAIHNLKDKFTTINQYFKFDKFEFVSISIGYEKDEIAIKLYKYIIPKKEIKTDKLKKINIFFILDFCRNYIFLDDVIEFEDEFDIDIPEFYANEKELINEINSKLKKFKNKKKVKFIVKFLIGEKIKISNKYYSVITIKIESEKEKEEILIPFIKKI